MISELAAEVALETSTATTWPLAGTAEFGSLDPEWRMRTLRWFEGSFERHVVQPWFPRALASDGTGFHSEFNHRWHRAPERARLLEHQARQTRSLARLAIARPEALWMRTAATEGLRYVRSAFWDSEHGGMYTIVGVDGQPLWGATKHAHGAAYAIGAAAEVFRLTGDKEARLFAFDIYHWLDQHLHDLAHGGYHGWATRDGRPILGSADVPVTLPQHERDHLGHGVGLKDANVHTDLLEAFSVLVEVTGDEAVRRRLEELYDVVAHAFATPTGAVHYLTDAALTPVPGLEQYGYPAQVGYRLCHAAAALGLSLDDAFAQARTIADHVLRYAVDPKLNGINEAGPAVDPTSLSGRDLVVRSHPWWVQTETAQLLITVVANWPEETRYREALDRLLAFVDRDMLDRGNGGLLRRPTRDWTLRQRLLRPDHKADQWKDASHETDLWLRALRILAGLPAESPIATKVAPV